jgi:hypothetical protein
VLCSSFDTLWGPYSGFAQIVITIKKNLVAHLAAHSNSTFLFSFAEDMQKEHIACNLELRRRQYLPLSREIPALYAPRDIALIRQTFCTLGAYPQYQYELAGGTPVRQVHAGKPTEPAIPERRGGGKGGTKSLLHEQPIRHGLDIQRNRRILVGPACRVGRHSESFGAW